MIQIKFSYLYEGDVEEQIVDTFENNIFVYLRDSSKDYYARKAQEWSVLSVPDFLKTANRYLEAERVRGEFYPEFKDQIMTTVLEEVSVKTCDSLVKNTQSGLYQLLTKKDLDNVKSLFIFHIEAKVDLSNFTASYLSYIKHVISEFRKESVDDSNSIDHIKVIEKLIDYRDEMFKICDYCFESNKSISDSTFLVLQSEFSKVKNYPKMLADFIDNFIVLNGKNLESDDTQKGIESIFKMINLTAERVDFLHFYEQTLSKIMVTFRESFVVGNQLL